MVNWLYDGCRGVFSWLYDGCRVVVNWLYDGCRGWSIGCMMVVEGGNWLYDGCQLVV